MLNFLLAEQATSNWTQYIMLGVLVIFFIGMMMFSSRSQKKRKAKVEEMIIALGVGDQIKTIGGFIGEIVEVCSDNAFVIKTGVNDKFSYMKIDKSAIYAAGEGANQKTTEDAEKDKSDPKDVYSETVE